MQTMNVAEVLGTTLCRCTSHSGFTGGESCEVYDTAKVLYNLLHTV